MVLAYTTTPASPMPPTSSASRIRTALAFFKSKEFFISASFALIWLASNYTLGWSADGRKSLITIALGATVISVIAVEHTFDLAKKIRSAGSSLAARTTTLANNMTTLTDRHTQYQAINNQVNKNITTELNSIRAVLSTMRGLDDFAEAVHGFMQSQSEVNATLAARLNDAEVELRIMRQAVSLSKRNGSQATDAIQDVSSRPAHPK
ncbi:hypothetical protein LTR70_004836 [Exophiala xenobiotica]|uniref:Uncharacterized protein n=1 Tax=Lithohypha guttulata TaxID=1690604 RepID=A0ABR0KBX0_9EURO|nr:hypothetical protein LTR24_004454 [Lithohypha guttulata]KAK5319792.1 hypothetical protein LTR70_004836 [Exophiala xenobiotica]